jgi:hypothetical protein
MLLYDDPYYCTMSLSIIGSGSRVPLQAMSQQSINNILKRLALELTPVHPSKAEARQRQLEVEVIHMFSVIYISVHVTLT